MDETLGMGGCLETLTLDVSIGIPNSTTLIARGSSWPWLYGCWIYNYLCSRCLSPLMLWVRLTLRARCTTLCLVVFSGSSGFLHQ